MSRRLIKNLLIDLLASKPVSSAAAKIIGTGIPIFMLHRLFPDHTAGEKQTPSYLRQCLSYLKDRGYHFMSVTDILLCLKNNTPLPQKAIAFTIDDGFYDQASVAAPVFIEFNCPVTIFLITDFLDGKSWPWFSRIEYLIANTQASSIECRLSQTKTVYALTTDQQKKKAKRGIVETVKKLPWDRLDDILAHLSDITQVDIPSSPTDQYKPMTWQMARELEKSVVSFGPHTLSHPIMSKVNDEQSFIEITQSWQRLNDELDHPCPVFCYPNGVPTDYGQREVEIIKQTDMLGALSTIPRSFQPNSGNSDYLYHIPRYAFPDDMSNFKMYCSWIEYAKEKYRYSR